MATLENSSADLRHLNIELPYDQTIQLLGIYPKEHGHTKMCTWMFIGAALIIAKKWKQPKCPPTGEWINKMCYIHQIWHKKEWTANTWMNLEDSMQMKESQKITSYLETYC